MSHLARGFSVTLLNHMTTLPPMGKPSLTLLVDLDDTLLSTHLSDFVPAYFTALSEHLTKHVAPDRLVSALAAGTRAMTANADPRRTLQRVFEAEFYPRIGIGKELLRDSIEDFYDRVYPTLRSLTDRVPEAESFVAWALARETPVAIATDPLFPRKATHQRLQWAGLEPSDFEIVSTFEEFHFSKQHPAYFAELLGRLGCPEGRVLMLGDDPIRDIAPAHSIGLETYLVNGRTAAGADGDWAAARRRIQDAPETTGRKSDREALLPTMLATPAALHGMTLALVDEAWRFQAAPPDWSLVELVCHLRDVEREIHHSQLRMFRDMREPFLPRPDAGVWARQRPYQQESGVAALGEFLEARMATFAELESLDAQEWERGARHAIFGPTTFVEVITFMAEHDRLHLQQAWKTLRARSEAGRVPGASPVL